MNPYVKRAMSSLFQSGKDTLRVSKDLYVIMIPVIILVKILQEYGLIKYAAMPLAPIMEMVGLPPEMGLAWAAALLNNMYSGIIVFLQLAQNSSEPITTAQVTILGGMMLIAHAIPVECGVARRCGTRFLTQTTIRVSAAILFGLMYHLITTHFDYLMEPAAIPLPMGDANADQTITQWALAEGKKLLWISTIIFVLLNAMNLLKFIGILNVISKTLEPMMRLIGVGRKASTITMIGLTLGLSYGSGIIIKESQAGELTKEDVFFCLSFMGICHSLIEDVMLVVLIGGDWFALLITRTILCLLIIAAMVRVVRIMPDSAKTRYLWTPEKTAPATS